jgi:ADP-heptose:LPS heptosyltransferase
LIFGGHYERDVVTKIRKKVGGNDIFVMPELTLCQMAAAFKMCRVLICNDSGPMHVGIATKTHVVAIFGPTYPSRFGPKDLEMNRIVKPRIGCSPCWHPDNSIGCKDRKCLRSITADQVFKAVKELVPS